MLFSRDKSNDFSHVMVTMHAICPLTIVNQLHRTLNLLSSETDLTPIQSKPDGKIIHNVLMTIEMILRIKSYAKVTNGDRQFKRKTLKYS